MGKPKAAEKTCIEDPRYVETRKTIASFEKKFKLYIISAFIYGLVFINYIDVITIGSSESGYHFWLSLMYFFPFIGLSLAFVKNWQLSMGLGFLASLMNDVFYGLVSNLMGVPRDLSRYYSLWLIPSNTQLFSLNLGFAVIPVFSWMMALSIYLRIPLIYLLLKSWKTQAKIRCLTEPPKQSVLTRWMTKVKQALKR